jgi:hypothetical protein
MALFSRYLTTLEVAVNAFYNHHQDNIRFSYRCFDRILLNGLIQPFQQPERVIGFFNTYRQLYPVSRDVLRDIAGQFQNWVKNRSETWRVPILEAPQGRRDDFVEPYFRKAKPDQVVVILKAREPARILIGICTPHHRDAARLPRSRQTQGEPLQNPAKRLHLTRHLMCFHGGTGRSRFC